MKTERMMWNGIEHAGRLRISGFGRRPTLLVDDAEPRVDRHRRNVDTGRPTGKFKPELLFFFSIDRFFTDYIRAFIFRSLSHV